MSYTPTEIYEKYVSSIIPIGWVYYNYQDVEDIPIECLLPGTLDGHTLVVLPIATAFIVKMNIESTILLTSNHAFPEIEKGKKDVSVIIPPRARNPFDLANISKDDFPAYLGLIRYKRLINQDICIFEIETPENLWIKQPKLIPLDLEFTVGIPVCTLGYPFIGYSGFIESNGPTIDFVERISTANLSAVWINNDTLTLEFDNYIGPGNSGGPLFNLNTGKVIGVISWSRVENDQVTTHSHASFIGEINRARNDFPELPLQDFNCEHCYDKQFKKIF